MTRMVKAGLVTMVLGLVATVSPASAAPKSKVQFSSASYHAAEDAGAVTITMRRTRSLQSPATVEYTTAAGTATPGVDYTHTSGTVTFPAATAGTKSQTVTFDVPILDDGSLEVNETINVSLRPVSGGIAGGSSSVITVIDDEGAARVSFAASTESAAENSGSVEIEVMRSGDITGTATVAYARTGGTAAEDPAPIAGTLSFATGEYVRAFTVSLADNAVQDGNRTMEFTLSAPIGAELAAPAGSTLTVIDDETPSQVRFEVAAGTVGESDGVALMTITRAGSYTGQTVSVDYATSDGSARSGEDYEATSGTAVLEGPDPTIPGDSGEESVTVEVPITNDVAEESGETFEVQLSAPSAGAVLGTRTAMTATIADDDAPVTPTDPPPTNTSANTTTTTTNTTNTTTTTETASGQVQSLTASKLTGRLQILKQRVLRKRGVQMVIACSGQCRATLGGVLRVRGARAIKLRARTFQLRTGAPIKTTLRLTKRQLRSLRRVAGLRRKPLRVTVTLRATNAGGAAVTVTRRLKLRA